jgi:hypothetical protein
VGSFDDLLNSLVSAAASLPTLVYAVNEFITAAELICMRVVVFGLFLYGLYKLVRRGG